MKNNQITSEQIREVVKELRKSEKEMKDKLLRHYNHNNKERGYWALLGCQKCLKLKMKPLIKLLK